MKKTLIGLLLLSVLTGCNNPESAKLNVNSPSQPSSPTNNVTQSQYQDGKNIKENTNTVGPSEYELNAAFTLQGVIKSIEGPKITVTANNKDFILNISSRTNFQKGETPGTGDIRDLKPGIKVRFYIYNDVTILIKY